MNRIGGSLSPRSLRQPRDAHLRDRRTQIATAILNAAVYPLAGSPDTVANSEFRLSAKMLSRVWDVGLAPREAYTPLAYTAE